MPRQTNTKELIISSAFLMYRRLLFKEFSLSDVAKAAGISKTAIFRHFKNKEELLSFMNDRFFEAFEELAQKIQSESGKRTLEATQKSVEFVIEFDEAHPGYMEYYVQSLRANEKVAAHMVKIMTDNHLNPINESVFKDEKELIPENIIPVYIEITILSLLIEKARVLEQEPKAENDNQFKTKIASIIFKGLGRKKNPLSQNRRKELDVLCELNLEKNEAHNRFFNAFVKLIQKDGGAKITVERIAEELGMAKSSVYAFFSNKMDYLENMLRQEMRYFGDIIKEKCSLVKNPDEIIYIMIRTEVNYFTARPHVMVMHAFLTYHNLNVFDDAFSVDDYSFLTESLSENFNLGFSDSKLVFIKWISVLAVSFMFMGRKYNFPPAWQDFYISMVYEFIECGTKSCIKHREENRRKYEK